MLRTRPSLADPLPDVADPYSQKKIDDNDDDPKRTLGLVSCTFLIFNRMIGCGIFATPATILVLAGSVGMSLILWLAGTIICVAGLLVYIEYGTALPQSGGEKNYLEYVYRRPKLLVGCMYAANAVFLGWAGSNSVIFGEYILFAAGVDKPGVWELRGVGLCCVTFAFLLHSIFPKWGIRLQNLLGGLKLIILLFVVLSGFAAMGGVLRVPAPDNFKDVWSGTSTSGYEYASALFNVIWSFIGYNNANYALGEVKNPIRTMKIAGPLAVGIVSVLYLLANIAYLTAVPRSQFEGSGVTIAGQFFLNVYGDVMGQRIFPLFICLSALGNVLSVIFSQGRINQELGKEGLLPFSRFWASSRPFNSPFAGLFLHWIFAVVMMTAPPAGSAYNFILSVISYPLSVINVAVSVGLLLLRYKVLPYDWDPPYKTPLVVTVFFLVANIFLVVLPFVPPPDAMDDELPFYLSCLVGILILVAGALYWTAWLVVWPRLGGFRWERNTAVFEDDVTIFEYSKVYERDETLPSTRENASEEKRTAVKETETETGLTEKRPVESSSSYAREEASRPPSYTAP